MRLGPRIALLFVLSGLLPLLLLGGFSFWRSQSALIRNAKAHVLSVSVLKEDELLQWMDANQAILESVAHRPLVIDLAAQLIDAPRGSEDWTALRDGLVENHLLPNLTLRGLTDFHIIHPGTGQILVATEGRDEGKFRESEDFFVEGKTATYIGRVTYSVAAEELVMHLSTPLALTDGSLAGVLSAHVNLEEMGRILRLSSGMHATEDSYAINDSAFFTTEPLYGESYAMRRTIHTVGSKAILRGEDGVAVYDDYRGVRVIGAYRWIEALNLGLLVEVDWSEVTAPVKDLRRAIMLLGALVGGLVVLGSIALARGIVRPIRELVAGTEALGAGNLDIRLEARGGDELGELTASFNAMAESLKAVTASRDELDAEVASRERAEEALRVQWTNLVTILDGIPHVIYVSDPKTHEMLFVNRYFREILGGDPVGKVCYEAIQGFDAPCDFCTNARILETREPYTWEYFNPMLQKHFIITDRIISWTDRAQARLELAMDVTERRALELKMLEAKEMTDAIIASLPGIFYQISPEGRFVRWNRVFREASGRTDEEIARISPLDLFEGEDRQRVEAEIQRVFETGEGSLTADLVSKDGTKTPFYLTGLRMRVEGMPWLIGVGTDISDLSRIEAELRRSMDELKRSNQELEQFAYVASHDLQEPLRMVASYTQLLERRYRDQLDRDATDFIHYAVDGANRMQRLINDLLQYSRVKTRGEPLRSTDLNAVLGQVHRNLATAIDESRAIITHDELPMVPADESQLASVFQNLLSNAIKFCRDEIPRIHVAAEDRGDAWQISVEDNGIGIDPEFQDRIFRIFQRLHGRDEYPGTGIGLAIGRRIVERHGGRLWVESRLGEGATFYFTLPKGQEGETEHGCDDTTD